MAEAPLRSVVLGDEHSCVLDHNGTVSCWGRNASGQLGDGTRADRHVPAPVIGLDGVEQIVAFGARTCAVRRDGAHFFWGHLDGLVVTAMQGRTEAGAASTVPRRITGLPPLREIALGAEHACARDREDRVRCWGKNDHGQVGDGTRADRFDPALIAGLPRASGLALGTSHSCALTEDGVWCWGANEGGQLGDGTLVDRARATRLVDFTGAAQIVASGASTCARMKNGTARCWGWNSDGQLGDGTRQGHAIPKAVHGLEQLVDVSLGASTACALRADGVTVCWGERAVDPVGPFDEPRRLLPSERGLEAVTTLARAGQISGGHQCAVQAGLIVRCWGPNAFGQLGEPGPVSLTRVTLSPAPAAHAAR